MKDFTEIFFLGQAFFQTRGHSLPREEFKADLKNMTLKFSDYESCKFAFTAMLGLRANSEEIQKQAVLSILNFNPNIEVPS